MRISDPYNRSLWALVRYIDEPSDTSRFWLDAWTERTRLEPGYRTNKDVRTSRIRKHIERLRDRSKWMQGQSNE